jgi:flagellar biosynthesis/type III secretory pathway protein FliH
MVTERSELVDRDFLSNLQKGYYKGSLPYPGDVKKPAILSRRVDELTDEEIAELPTIRAEYQKAQAEARKGLDAYHEEQNRLYTQFREDIAEFYKMTDHPKKDKVFAKAWEDGHSSGFEEVHNHYAELVQLVR